MPESRRYQLQNESANRLIGELLAEAGVPDDRRGYYQQLLTTVLKLHEDGASLADLTVTNVALKELRYAFKVFAPYRNQRKVTVFGSARLPPEHPAYHQAVLFSRKIAQAGFMVITGAASGIMEAGHVGAGRENSIGVNILLPFEQEANAIGTEYIRVDLLPAADAAKVRGLLLSYLDQRVLFYTTRDEQPLEQINARTAKLQAELWSAVQVPASAQPTPLIALAVAGMNDVLNSQGYTQAAWWNRIPIAAWMLMAAIAICATLLVGIGAKSAKADSRLLVVLPLVVSIAFFLIADIDSPRRGVIRVIPQNLMSLGQSLHAH